MPLDGRNFPYTEVKLSPVTKHLIRARDRIAKGWCQGVEQRGDAFCMSGAIMAESGSYAQYSAVSALISLALPHYPHHHLNIVLYNDYPDRTKEEVLAVFDKAIALSMEK